MIKSSKTVKTIRKIKVISKKESVPPSDISFEEWLVMGKKMGWDKQSQSIPLLLPTYTEDNDQIKRHADFLRSMTQLMKKMEAVSEGMEETNRSFKTEDKTEIFDPKMFANIEVLKGIIEYYRTGAIDQKKQLYEEQAYLVYNRYRNDKDFKKHVNEWLDSKLKKRGLPSEREYHLSYM